MHADELRFVPFREGDRRYLPLVALLGLVFVTLFLVLFVLYHPEAVSGDSMLTTLHSGDRVLVTHDYPVPARGDVVLADIVYHGSPDTVLKRVVAIGGDTVEVDGDRITVNGELASWPGVIVGEADRFHLGPFLIPDGFVYLAGDNRPVSLDSRFFGPVESSAIHGRVVAVISPLTHAGRID